MYARFPFSIHQKTWYSNVTHIRGSVISMQKARRPADFPGIKFTIADNGLRKEIVGVWSWGNPMAVVGNRSWTRRSLNFRKREEERERNRFSFWIMKNRLIILSVDNTCINAYPCIRFYFFDSFLMFRHDSIWWGKYGRVLGIGDVGRINCISMWNNIVFSIIMRTNLFIKLEMKMDE